MIMTINVKCGLLNCYIGGKLRFFYSKYNKILKEVKIQDKHKVSHKSKNLSPPLTTLPHDHNDT